MDNQIDVHIENVLTATFCSGQKAFFIPKYQRPYSWDRKHVEDLWNDLLFALEQNSTMPYMMGSVYIARVSPDTLRHHVNDDILQDEIVAPLIGDENELYFIIDGQQRITTLFLLLLTLNDEHITRSLYLNNVPKLVLSKVDYQYFLALVQGESVKPSTMSHRRLGSCYDFFKKKVATFLAVKEMTNFITTNVNIVKIEVVQNLELATSLFISQTDRGKRLTNLEKLKSTLMFYNQKIDKTPEIETEIDDLFGGLFETIESLCSRKLYRKPEHAEADVLRIMNFMLLRANFYNKYLNDFIKDEKERAERKVEIWYEAGEDRIYEAVVKVLRESLELNRGQIKYIVNDLIGQIKDVQSLFRYLVDQAVPKETDNCLKDPYENKRWYPFKQLFGILGLSVFSKALLVALHKAGTDEGTDPLRMDNYFPEATSRGDVDIFEKIDKVKNLREKLSTLLTKNPTALQKDIESIWYIPEIKKFLADKMARTNSAIDHYRFYAAKPISIANLIEENELAIWQNNKRPVGSFVWEKNGTQAILAHVRNFSFGYKEDYLIRDLSYANFKYVLFEYERLTQEYTDEELLKVFNYDIDEDDGIMIQREHIFPVQPKNYDTLSSLWSSVSGETYADWIWRIGNITLLEHAVNIADAGNKSVWEKAKAYQEKSLFKGTKALAGEILTLKNICDSQKASAEQLLLAMKIYLEIRELELYAFTFLRFA